MNYEQIKHQAELDSRRVSTGVLCRIIRDEGNKGAFTGLLSELKVAGYWPIHVNSIDPIAGIDPATGVCICMPVHMVSFFKGEWRNLVKSIKDTRDTKDEEGRLSFAAGEARRKTIRGEFLRNIQEHLMIGNIDIKVGTTATGLEHDVYIETREQNEPRATLVRKGTDDGGGKDPEVDPNTFDNRSSTGYQKWVTDQQKRRAKK